MTIAADRATLVRACKLYYLEEKSQDQIARELRVSRPSVSRLLEQARRERIVEFHVRDEDEQAAWRAIGRDLGLRELIVAPGQGREVVGAAAAEHFSRLVRAGDVVGLTAGRTLSAFVAGLRPRRQLDLEIVPLVGTLWETGQEYDGSFLCQELRRRVGGNHWILSVPAVVRDASLAGQLLREPRVQGVLERYGSVRCAFVGVGDVSAEHPLVQAAGSRSVLPREAFVSVGRMFFDREGRPCPTALDGRTLGMSHEELAAVPNRVGLAAGKAKADLVRALVMGQVLTTLVVDEPLARALGRTRVPRGTRQTSRQESRS